MCLQSESCFVSWLLGLAESIPLLAISVRFVQAEAHLVPLCPYTSGVRGVETPLQPLQESRRSCPSIPHLARRKALQPRCHQLHQRRMREAEEPDSSHKAAQVLQRWWNRPAQQENGTLSILREWRSPGWHSFRQGHFSDHTGTLRYC